jgi:hypothetical protein
MQVASAPSKWLRAKIPVAAGAGSNGNGAAAAPLLEFVVTDGSGSWDKPAGAQLTDHSCEATAH